MDAFIQPHQYHYIKQQVKKIVSAQANSNDSQVIQAVKEIAMEELEKQLDHLSEEQKEILSAIQTMKDREDIDPFLQQLKQYVISFPLISEKQLQKAFPKVKKLKMPDLEPFDRKETVYLRWDDVSLNKTFMLIPKDEKLIGVQGQLDTTQQKGICSLCNGLENVSLFTSAKKGQMRGTYSKRGNYICKDPISCNQNIATLQLLHNFIDRLQA
ncbi:FusB/FusC family EF-G-binding protein [Gracilibacillus sp. S3-1-1]|uniref:FusB/FusC family EF-G-binding protein n=1 Tax=Gracilibacillus pellucidus TaxID=3095368 RepID=A0ACC6M741_9BACI|nr:FusB/FusC family EF-G-binding protein [Gracilibacillus sp. S3-1-1]MDX8046745.1 FusB/FusC family EF-G-binding protein [Gracilibacillus sp. S3-1-1]